MSLVEFNMAAAAVDSKGHISSIEMNQTLPTIA
jgi:hypothetical protein